MKTQLSGLLLLLFAVSCAPTNYLKLDVINPAVITLPDTGKVVILNAAYLPSVVKTKENLIPLLQTNEQNIFDTITITNLFNGLFSILNESPAENLKYADYEEIRTLDTTNFLLPLSAEGVTSICNSHNARFLVSMEYYDFNRKESTGFSFEGDWETRLFITRKLVWRIYGNDGVLLDQFLDKDSLSWYNTSIPELTDAVRETFFFAGEKYGRRISPYWSEISRQYFLISRDANDISLDKDKLIEVSSSKKHSLSYKACYNLAIVSESEDNLPEAIIWVEKAFMIKQTQMASYYLLKLQSRLETHELLDMQSGINQ